MPNEPLMIAWEWRALRHMRRDRQTESSFQSCGYLQTSARDTCAVPDYPTRRVSGLTGELAFVSEDFPKAPFNPHLRILEE